MGEKYKFNIDKYMEIRVVKLKLLTDHMTKINESYLFFFYKKIYL